MSQLVLGDSCEHTKKRGHLGFCASCLISLYRNEAIKRGVTIRAQQTKLKQQQAKMLQLRKALGRAARGTTHVHAPTCAGDNKSYNGPGGPGHCHHCGANLVLLRQIQKALEPMKATHE